jgi:putative adenylate-forming enzyme
MGSRIEIARAFVLARRRSRWSVERLRAHQARHAGSVGCAIETPDQFEERFAERNALGLTMEQARAEAERELEGQAPRFPGYSFGFSTGTFSGAFSGSKGRAGVFLTSERERNAWVGTVLGKFLPLRMLAGSDVALVLKHNNRLYTDVRKTRGVRLHYFNASASVGDWVNELCCLRPDVLVGPPSILEQVALTPMFARRPFRPALLLAGAEPLYPQDQAFLERAYGVTPRVIYQAKEGLLAAGCRKGSIHLNEDLIYFEALPLGAARFVPVITDFTRTSQRYRRFRLDDVLIASSAPCTCGQPFANVAAVEGRAQDVLLLGGERIFPLEVNELLLPHLAAGEPSRGARSRDYRVTQTAEDRIALAIEGGAPPDLVRLVAARVRPALISTEEYEPPMLGEKRRRIRRQFDVHNDWLNRLTVSTNVFSGV